MNGMVWLGPNDARSGTRRVVFAAAMLSLLAAICKTTAQAAPLDACNLLSDAQVHMLAPSLGKARHSKVKIKNVSICEWPDAHGIMGLMLQVAPAPSHSLRKDLASGVAAMGGYDIRNVSGLGDEAAMAIQRPNPKYGLHEGIAILSVRVGKRVVSLSPARVPIKPGTDRFKQLKKLAAEAASHL